MSESVLEELADGAPMGAATRIVCGANDGTCGASLNGCCGFYRSEVLRASGRLSASCRVRKSEAIVQAIAFLASVTQDPSTSDAARLPDIYWNKTNPMFRIDNTDHIIDVNRGNALFDYDQVNLVCPKYDLDVSEDHTEKYVIYSVTRAEYDACSVFEPIRARTIAQCNRPYQSMYFTITFRSFTPQPGGLEFKPGHDYFFIAAAASPSHAGAADHDDNPCLTRNMRVQFKVCCKQEEDATAGTPGMARLPVPDPESHVNVVASLEHRRPITGVLSNQVGQTRDRHTLGIYVPQSPSKEQTRSGASENSILVDYTSQNTRKRPTYNAQFSERTESNKTKIEVADGSRRDDDIHSIEPALALWARKTGGKVLTDLDKDRNSTHRDALQQLPLSHHTARRQSGRVRQSHDAADRTSADEASDRLSEFNDVRETTSFERTSITPSTTSQTSAVSSANTNCLIVILLWPVCLISSVTAASLLYLVSNPVVALR